LEEIGLNLLDCVGIGTDGFAMMVSINCGVVVEIQTKTENASHCPCFNHALNLFLSRSSAVLSIRNAIGIIKEAVAFFNAYVKRNYVLNKVLKAKLMGMCKTRWIEWHKSLMQFVSELPKIIQSLEHISHWSESVATPNAKMLVTVLHSEEFVVSLQCLHSNLCCDLAS
jgi:hypothetical protein